MAISQATVALAGATIYTSSGQSAITAAFFLNDHSSAVALDLHIVKSGQTAAASNRIIKSLSINAADAYVLDTERLLLENGDFLYASADVDNVVYTTISYIGV